MGVLSKHDNWGLNPNAETFNPLSRTTLCGSSTPTNSKYSDTSCTDYFNLINFGNISMGDTCSNKVHDLTTFPHFLSLSAFSLMLSIAIFLNLEQVYICNNNIADPTEICVVDQLREIRLKNPKKVTLGHLNINSIPNKFESIMEIVANNLDIFLISETKIDDSFPDVQFCFNGYSKPHRKDRALGAGGLLMYVNENIPSRKISELALPDDIEIMCVEINLKKQKWALIGIYRPPALRESYFLDHLSRTIDYYSKKYDKVVIMGDFNSEPSDIPIEAFCDSYNLYNLVKEKTCFKGQPKCYDLILTNCKNSFQSTKVVTTGLSDFHKMTVTVLKTEFIKEDSIQINYRDYKNYNHLKFSEHLSRELQKDVSSNNSYNNFQSILSSILDIHAPLKKKYLRANNSPFMTKQMRKMIMNRSRCKNTYFKNKTVENWENYRKLRNECVKLTKKVKKEYFENLNINSVNDNKTFWKTIKPFFTDKNKNNGKIVLVENKEIIMENRINAEIMNEYFVNITQTLDIPKFETEKIPADIQYIDPIDEIIYNFSKHPSIIKLNSIIKPDINFSFDKVNNTQIEKEILQLNVKKSAGPDDIPAKIVKDSFIVLTPPLTKLFNTSIDENFFPEDLKHANVSPLFKKDDNTAKENYRPISILPSISKNFERLMFQQITSYVSNFLSPYLCGFRKGYNAQHALMRLKDHLNKSLDEKKNIGLIMMDLSKAFDCIPHNLLIAKLYAYGFDKNSLKLIHSYLKGRHQRVKINSEFSSWKEIINGVPQGSVLGPLLFNIFINDLFLFVENSEIYNYADDNSLTFADTNINNIITKLESDIEILNSWFKDNSMSLNGDKCQFMIVGPSRTPRNTIEKVTIDGKIVNECKKGKLLGITLDNQITMNDHIKRICKQASNKLYALARISHYLDANKRKMLMKSFIISQFNYCPIIWMYCQRKCNNTINRIHERALRIAYGDYVSDFNTLLVNDNSVTIHQRNIQALSLEIYKTVNNLNPIFMKNIFHLKEINYSTRMQNLSYPNPKTTSYGLQSFGYKATQVWSKIPHKMKQSNINKFKNEIAEHCRNICNCTLCKSYIQNLGYIDNNECQS